MIFELRGETIALAALLKATGVAPSGGAAKAMVDAGEVRVDGRPETRRTRTLRAGQVVEAGDARIELRAGGGAQVRT